MEGRTSDEDFDRWAAEDAIHQKMSTHPPIPCRLEQITRRREELTPYRKKLPPIELKPCPFCGSNRVLLRESTFRRQVECDTCTASGPVDTRREVAAAMWNAVSRVDTPAARNPEFRYLRHKYPPHREIRLPMDGRPGWSRPSAEFRGQNPFGFDGWTELPWRDITDFYGPGGLIHEEWEEFVPESDPPDLD